MWGKLAVGAALALALAGAGLLAWYQLVKAGVLRYNEYDRRERGSLQVGQPAPDLVLTRYEGGELRLSELWRSRPVFLVFGSCT